MLPECPLFTFFHIAAFDFKRTNITLKLDAINHLT